MPQAPDFLETYSLVMRAALFVVLFGGLGLALGRASLPMGVRVRAWLVMVVTTLVWFGVVSHLAGRGFFQAAAGVQIPAIPFAVILPVILGLWLLMRSATVATLIDATPLSWLVGVQAYRVLGAIFLVLWAGGLLPGQFALPAGAGDVLVGILAIAVATMAAIGARGARHAAYAWNLFGILDLVVALATGFLTSPGRFQLLALDQPNLLTTAYPLVMIPAFAVPLSLILHGVCLWKLRREAERRTSGASGMAAPA